MSMPAHLNASNLGSASDGSNECVAVQPLDARSATAAAGYSRPPVVCVRALPWGASATCDFEARQAAGMPSAGSAGASAAFVPVCWSGATNGVTMHCIAVPYQALLSLKSGLPAVPALNGEGTYL